jgi:hypothetical protein
LNDSAHIFLLKPNDLKAHVSLRLRA